jgi:hypothetical protein
MKVNELQGAALDWAVAKCEGFESWEVPVCCLRVYQHKDGRYFQGNSWQPSTDWAQGGPIIERERIRLWAMNWDSQWEADFPQCEGPRDDIRVAGPTPLIAAMRCYVASKLGDEVEIPEELK